MTNRYNTNRNRKVRSLRSTGWQGVKFIARVAEKSAEGLFRWATTDHSGMNMALINMPGMGFIDTIKCTFGMLCYSLVYALAMGVAAFVTFAYWIPFLLGIIFS